jgi:MmgE/PrpD N-terminal domain
VPAGARAAAKIFIADTFAVGIAGRTTPWRTEILDMLAGIGGAPEATVLGSGERLPLAHAAMLNAYQIHGQVDVAATLGLCSRSPMRFFRPANVGGFPARPLSPDAARAKFTECWRSVDDLPCGQAAVFWDAVSAPRSARRCPKPRGAD